MEGKKVGNARGQKMKTKYMITVIPRVCGNVLKAHCS